MSIVDGSELHAHPSKRRRCQTAGLVRGMVRWVGPEDYRTDYRRRFHKATMITREEYMKSSAEERVEHYRVMAAARNNHVSCAEIRAISKKDLMQLIFPLAQCSVLGSGRISTLSFQH